MRHEVEAFSLVVLTFIMLLCFSYGYGAQSQGMKMTTQIKTVKLFMKHNDTAFIEAVDPNGVTVFERDGYMPYVGVLGGDESSFEVDNETGKIKGWEPIKLEDLENSEDK